MSSMMGGTITGVHGYAACEENILVILPECDYTSVHYCTYTGRVWQLYDKQWEFPSEHFQTCCYTYKCLVNGFEFFAQMNV